MWSSTGALTTTRYHQSATLLPNGKVLLAGGNFDVAHAELYEPTTGTWTATGALATPREYHTATLLPNGKVLVAGGAGPSLFSISSVELYDPATGIWTATSGLATPRQFHTATLLPNGKVLVAGGLARNYSPLSSAELYDPASGTWTETGTMITARYYATASLLLDGKVLFACGFNSDYVTNVELYDPAAGTWMASSEVITPRYSPAATVLSRGTVLVSGGRSSIGAVSNSELYDTGLGFRASWQAQVATLSSPLRYGDRLALSGSQFRGVSEGSGGTSQDSPTDYPVVQVRTLENGHTSFLLPDPGTNWSTTSFTSLPVSGVPPGYALVTVFVNGIPSTASFLNLSVPVPSEATLTDAKVLTNGAFQFSFTNSPGALFSVLTTTNPALSLSNWLALGGVREISLGRFEFTDPQATNTPQRFYRLRSQ
jgi:hypothetical protein